MIVGINCVCVVLGPFFAVIFPGIKASGPDESTFVFSVTKGCSVIVHMHGGVVTLGVGADSGGFFFPGESVVTTAINKNIGRWMVFFDEGKDVPGGFIDRCAATLEAGIFDCDFRPPRGAAISGAASSDVSIPPCGDQSSFFRDNNIGEAFSLKERLDEGFFRGFFIKL